MAKKLIVLFILTPFLSVFFQNCSQNGFGVVSPPSAGEDVSDPLFIYAWHLKNTGQNVFSGTSATVGYDLGLQKTWGSGIYGQGIKILISDDGVEKLHEDLTDNFFSGKEYRDYLVSNWLSDSAPPSDVDFHGTSVAGLVAAVGWNGKGSLGVAPKAKMVATNFMSDNVTRTSPVIADQAKGSVDVVNMSWGYTQTNYTEIEPTFNDQLKFGTENGRSGKGVLYVRSAGNSRLELVGRSVNDYRLGSANFDGNNITPYSINVGAILANGKNAYYSSPGSNLWISAPGGDDGVTSPAMVTTDRTGCTLGYSNKNLTSPLAELGNGFLKGSNGNGSCNYTVTFNGTSSAAPNVTGSIALLLQAFPQLTWRDVKYILAKTAIKGISDGQPFENFLYQNNSTRFANHKSPTGYTWDDEWVVNDAGFNFNNLFGFGLINVDAAVEFAKTYMSLFTSSLQKKEFSISGLSLPVPDFNKDGVSSTVSVADNLRIEAIQVEVSVTHPNAGELAVELVNPNNKRSVLVNMNNSLDGTQNLSSFTFLTNKFYFEPSVGTWKLRIIDGRTGNQGTLTGWKLIIYGQ